MPTFSNIKQLTDYCKKHYADISLSNGKTLKTILKEEAERLRQLLVEHIQKGVYESYDPKVYQRTFGLLDSLRVDPVIHKGNELSVKIWFDNKALHPSVFGQDDGFVPILIDQGWEVKSGWHKNIPNFGIRPPTEFVKKACEDFTDKNPYGLRIEVHYDPPKGSSWTEEH